MRRDEHGLLPRGGLAGEGQPPVAVMVVREVAEGPAPDRVGDVAPALPAGALAGLRQRGTQGPQPLGARLRPDSGHAATLGAAVGRDKADRGRIRTGAAQYPHLFLELFDRGCR